MPALMTQFAPTILIFLPSPNEIQRFLLERAFADLDRHFNVVYALPASDRERYEPMIRDVYPTAELRFVERDAARSKSWSKLFKAACYRYADRSRSFAIRVERRYAGSRGAELLRQEREMFAGERASATWAQSLLSRVPRFRRKRDAEAQCLTAPDIGAKDPRRMFKEEVFAAFKDKTLENLKRDAAVDALIAEIDPLIVVIPSSLLDAFCNDVLWIAKERSIASFVIQSGWDNLSSKGIFFHAPDYVGVWGPQSLEHAVSIQDVATQKVVLLGAPHYEVLKHDAQARLEVRSRYGIGDDVQLILFGGSFRQFDETTALRRIEDEIDSRNWKVKVLYRPHPYRLDRDEEVDFFDRDWKHVLFDDEMSDRYRASKKEAGFIKRERPLYSMSYLARVLSAVDAVISPMSTLLIEAMIMGRPTLAIAYSDSHHDYSAGTAAEMTHFDALRKSTALTWCDDGDELISDLAHLLQKRAADASGPKGAGRKVLSGIVTQEPEDYASRVSAFVRNKVVPQALRRNEERRDKDSLISHHYGANYIAKRYVGLDAEVDAYVPGFWMHGWLPSSFNTMPALVALHKTEEADLGLRLKAHMQEKLDTVQWVSRPDQVECLKADGYARVEAIGLPFVYLPPVDVERRPGSLLVMPPHGMKKMFDARMADDYADAIVSIKDRFSAIAVCLTERDYYRGEWRPQFQARNIPVIIGSSHSQVNTLLQLKAMLSTFDYVTSNSFGSQIAYAAHCGAKVSIFGPFCEWDRTRTSYATRMFPKAIDVLVESLSEEHLRKTFPFLFVHPAETERAQAWGDEQIGVPWRRSPEELKTLFGW